MAVTTRQALKVRLLLGITNADEITAMDTALAALDDDGIEELELILAAAEPIELLQVSLNSDGVMLSQTEQLDGLRARLAVLLKVANAFVGYVGTVEPPDEDEEEDE